MKRLSRWARFPWDDKVLLAETAALTVLFRVVMSLAPFARTQRLAASLADGLPGSRRKRVRQAARIGRAVEIVGRSLPLASCLSQALAAQVLLTRSGHDAEIRIGVTRKSDGRLAAHAWVELDGHVLVGDHEIERFVAASGPGKVA